MAAITESFDVRIRVVYPLLTKSLPKDDSKRINATGNFNFEPPPQVDTTQGLAAKSSPVKSIGVEERVDNLKNGLDALLVDFDRIQDMMRKRAGHITLEYDSELTQNEALANAEAELFGGASGQITYSMFEEALALQEKVDKYISHMSVENDGVLNGAA